MTLQPYQHGIELEGYAIFVLAIIGAVVGIVIFARRFPRAGK